MAVEKPKRPPLAFVGILLRVIMVLLFLTTVLINLFVAYIIIFPNTFPKPFYPVYQGDIPEAFPQEGNVVNPMGGEVTTTVESESFSEPYTPGEGIIIETGTKIVNLAEPGGKKFIRANIALEFAPGDPEYRSLPEEERLAYVKTFKEELTAINPVLNDVIITLLSTKDFQSVYTSEGKEELRRQIIDTVNERLPEYKLIYVYFTEFVMQ